MRLFSYLVGAWVVVALFAGCPFGGPHPNGLSFIVEVTGLQNVDPKGDSLNDADIVAGAAITPPFNNINPVVWKDGTIQPVLHTFDYGFLHGLNNRGAAVGTELITGPGTFFHLVTFIDAAAPPSRTDVTGQIYSVNEFNEYVGTADNTAALGFVHSDHLSLFEGENGDSTAAYDINDWGDFVGSTLSTSASATLAVKWVGGVRTPLASFGGPFSEAYAINNHGIAVGVSTNPPPAKTTEPHKAVCWMDTAIVALPTLGGTEGTAWDINDEGEAVGSSLNENEESRAVLWRNVGNGTPSVIDLNDVTEFADAMLVLRDAIDINEVGTILCRADLTEGAMMTQVYVLLRR